MYFTNCKKDYRRVKFFLFWKMPCIFIIFMNLSQFQNCRSDFHSRLRLAESWNWQRTSGEDKGPIIIAPQKWKLSETPDYNPPLTQLHRVCFFHFIMRQFPSSLERTCSSFPSLEDLIREVIIGQIKERPLNIQNRNNKMVFMEAESVSWGQGFSTGLFPCVKKCKNSGSLHLKTLASL